MAFLSPSQPNWEADSTWLIPAAGVDDLHLRRQLAILLLNMLLT
jgi:hypothetical protein